MYFRLINNIFIDAGGWYSFSVHINEHPIKFQLGILYSFKFYYLSAGYRGFYDFVRITPSFYAGGGIRL